MSADRSEIIVLCEGSADERFVRRFLALRGYDLRKVYTRKYPAGRGCGEQFVRENFPKELIELRRRRARALIVLIDGDGKSIAQRKAELDAACKAADIPVRKADEAALIAGPSAQHRVLVRLSGRRRMVRDQGLCQKKERRPRPRFGKQTSRTLFQAASPPSTSTGIVARSLHGVAAPTMNSDAALFYGHVP